MPTLGRGARRGPHFLRRRHGLDPGDVGAAFAQALDLLDEDLDRLVFGQRPERREQVARRPDRTRDDDRPPGAVGDRARDLGGEPVQLARPVLELVQHQAPAVGPESVGQDDVGARVDESPMQALDPIGMLGVPELRRIAGGQAHGEKVGAGRPVREQRPAFGQKRLQHIRFSWGRRAFRPYLASWRSSARLGREQPFGLWRWSLTFVRRQRLMRVLVAGASGAIGPDSSPARRCRSQVTGLTRSPSKAEPLRRAGANPVVVDALDPPALREAVIDAQPEVVVHQMTALANASDLRHFDRAFAQTNRLRTEGLDHLLGAAREAAARKVVAQSYCGWPFARVGGPVKTEDDPLDSAPPREFERSLQAIRHLESVVAEATDFDGTVLRYGSFYGPGSGLFDGPALDQLRRRLFPVIGDGGGWWSFLHLDDAAEATACAIETGLGDLQYRR